MRLKPTLNKRLSALGISVALSIIFSLSAVAADFATTQALAKQGDATAQNELGNLYIQGELVSRDYAKALEWYKKSAYQGDAEAQYNLGYMYEIGIGVKADEDKAIEWYQKALRQGHADADKRLTIMFISSF